MPKRSRKKPVDVNQIARSIVDEVSEQTLQSESTQDGKNPAAVMLGRLGGLKGGKARAQKLSSEQRSEIARKAAKARWANKDG